MRRTHFDDWREAREAAEVAADAIGLDVGLERSGEGFRIFYLPKPENRAGHELRCEVVTPTEARSRCTST